MIEQQRQLQMTELEILKCVDSFCKQNNIRYSLYGGTLLGAVRHHGFIPWDDDLDICMLRSEYERFITLWKSEKHVGLIFQNKDTEPDFTQSFSKVRKDHTTFIQEYDIGKMYHKGIFVDIFPIDRYPRGINGKLYKFATMLYQQCCREFVPPQNKSSKIERTISSIFLACTNHVLRNRIRKALLNWFINFDKQSDLDLVSNETISTLRIKYPHDMADNYTELEFEGMLFPVWSRYNEALSIRYGDYLQLPPENERTWTHHPISLNFEKNEGEDS